MVSSAVVSSSPLSCVHFRPEIDHITVDLMFRPPPADLFHPAIFGDSGPVNYFIAGSTGDWGLPEMYLSSVLEVPIPLQHHGPDTRPNRAHAADNVNEP